MVDTGLGRVAVVQWSVVGDRWSVDDTVTEYTVRSRNYAPNDVTQREWQMKALFSSSCPMSPTKPDRFRDEVGSVWLC